jgi:hypothetical protein
MGCVDWVGWEEMYIVWHHRLGTSIGACVELEPLQAFHYPTHLFHCCLYKAYRPSIGPVKDLITDVYFTL